MNKAKFITAVKSRNPLDRHSWEHTDLIYEYRGHQYIVTAHNNGYFGDTLKEQHRREQAAIDQRINEAENHKEWQYEGSADQAFDESFEVLTNGNI